MVAVEIIWLGIDVLWLLVTLVFVIYFVVYVYITIKWILQTNLRYLIINFNLIKIIIISRWIKWDYRIIQVKRIDNCISLSEWIIKLIARIISKKLKLIYIYNLEVYLFELVSQVAIKILKHQLLDLLY